MQRNIYERGEVVGTLSVRRQGLYVCAQCRIAASPEKIRRVYALCGFDAVYLGIPDKSGRLEARIAASHFPREVTGAAAFSHPKGRWASWCGEVAQVFLQDALICAEAAGYTLAIDPNDELRFPAWAGKLEHRTIFGREAALVPLNLQGIPLLKETDKGDIDETTALPFDGTGLPCDASADGFGNIDETQTHCPDL